MKPIPGLTWRAFRRLASVLAMLLPLSEVTAMAQADSDSLSVTVYYPCGSSSISSIAGNEASLKLFVHQLDSVGQSPFFKPLSLFIASSTSPEGSAGINQALSRRRNQSVADALNRRSELFRTISASPECTVHERTTGHLLESTAQSAYPAMRHSKVTLLFSMEREDTVAALEAPSADVAVIAPADSLPEEPPVQPQPGSPHEAVSHPVAFIKTNLLLDCLTFVGASVEVPLARRLSAEATLVYPWWRSTSRHKTIQMRYVAVTPRYYFNNADRSYTSLFAGLTVGGGKYDLQWTRRGVQGSMWHVSPVIGYSHHISKRWKMEYSASVGFVHTKYQKYTQTSDTPYGEIKVKDYPWVSKVLNTVLPTSLNVSIVYTFTKSKRIGHHEE